MTLIVGVLCQESVVVASDGAATLGALGMSTARQAVRKLNNVNGHVIVGVSGPVGLSQLIVDRVQTLGTKLSGSHCPTPEAAMRTLSSALREDVEPALKAAAQAAPIIGHAAQNDAISNTVIALKVSQRPTLIQFSAQCAAEKATEDLPFVAIGSGQSMADPFLAFIRRMLWPDRQPNTAEGIFAAIWTLRHAIDTSPGGVADPIQLMVLDSAGIHEHSSQDLAEHQGNIKALEKHIAAYWTSSTDSDIPFDTSTGPNL